MKYEVLTAQEQESTLLNELRSLEAQHFRLTTQHPETEKGTAVYDEIRSLEDRIKTFQKQLRVVRGEEKPAKKAATRKKAAAKKTAATKRAAQSDQGGTDGGQTNNS